MQVRSIAIGIALGVMAVSLAVAQPSPPKPPSKAERLARLREGLDLTAEQIAPIEAILASTDKKVEEVLEQGLTAPRALMAAMKKIFDEEDAKIEHVLTDVQRTQFAKMKQDREKHRPGARGEVSPSHS